MLNKIAKIAPFFLIGPISGPLVAGVVFSLHGKRPVAAGLYGVALVGYCIGLPALVAKVSAWTLGMY